MKRDRIGAGTKIKKADGVCRVGLGTLGAGNSKSGDRKPLKKELEVSRDRVTVVVSVRGLHF